MVLPQYSSPLLQEICSYHSIVADSGPPLPGPPIPGVRHSRGPPNPNLNPNPNVQPREWRTLGMADPGSGEPVPCSLPITMQLSTDDIET